MSARIVYLLLFLLLAGVAVGGAGGCSKDENAHPPPPPGCDGGMACVNHPSPPAVRPPRSDGGTMRDASVPAEGGVTSGAIAGRVEQVTDVVRRAGTPAAGATVVAPGSELPSVQTTADAMGLFTLTDVDTTPPLFVSAQTLASEPIGISLVTSLGDARAYTVSRETINDLAASVGSTHSGSAGVLVIRIVDATGTPRPNVTVMSAVGIGPFYDVAGVLASGTATGVDGTFAFFEVARGFPTVCVQLGVSPTMSCAEIPSEIDAVTFATLILP